MAKIIYAVAGEGFGHSSRSQLIGQRFIDAGHDVMFVGSQKSLSYLSQYFGDRVKAIFGLAFAYEDGYVDPVETVKMNVRKLPAANKQNDELFKKYFEPFGPELVVSDFEPFSAWWALRNKVPFISIDHEHMLTLCKLKHKAKDWFPRLTAGFVTESYYVGAVAYVIVNFFTAPLKIDSAVLAPPIVRPAVTELEASEGDHILMYSTTGKGGDHLRIMLSEFSDFRFYVYGFEETGEFGNCVFKERSTEGFLGDLASCRGVVASAGFSLISECLYFKKRMLLLPIAGQYEQMINAYYIETLGLGVSAEQLDEQAMSRFLGQIDKAMPDNEKILWPDNNRFFQILENELKHMDIGISLA